MAVEAAVVPAAAAALYVNGAPNPLAAVFDPNAPAIAAIAPVIPVDVGGKTGPRFAYAAAVAPGVADVGR